MPTLKESIELEESLIRTYQAELNLLQQQQQQQQQQDNLKDKQTNNDGDDDDDDDDEDNLDWILFGQQNDESPSQKKIKVNLNTDLLSANKTEHIHLTQAIQGVVYTSIEKTKGTAATTTTQQSNNTSQQYVLQGYFLANTSVSFTLCLDVLVQSTYRKGKLKPFSSKMVGITCQLALSSSSEGDDDNANINISHLEELSRIYLNKTLSLADWSQKMSRYLEFQKRQQEHLRKLKSRFSCQWQPHDEDVFIMPKTGDGGRTLPRFTWGWNWMKEQDYLEISSSEDHNSSDDGLDWNKGLQDLVACTSGCCDKALELVLRALP